MLVLSRKLGQELRVGDDVIFKIIDVRGNNVRIGIDAPLSINIIRSELLPGDDLRMPDERIQSDGGPSTEDTGMFSDDTPRSSACSRDRCGMEI